MIQFDTIDYLQHGNVKQQKVYAVLNKNSILTQLIKFDPILVGSIPINIDIDESDLDIICFSSDLAEFRATVTSCFGEKEEFRVKEIKIGTHYTVIANFKLDGFQLEIFGQPVPTKQQAGYRHMVIEYNLLKKNGNNFRQQIIELKRRGFKTEPAFALVLGLKGDPYSELLKLDGLVD